MSPDVIRFLQRRPPAPLRPPCRRFDVGALVLRSGSRFSLCAVTPVVSVRGSVTPSLCVVSVFFGGGFHIGVALLLTVTYSLFSFFFLFLFTGNDVK